MMTAALWPAATVGIGREGSGDDWGIEGDFFQPAGNHTTDQRGMFRDAHGTLGEEKNNMSGKT
jgi:hypothetical protein